MADKIRAHFSSDGRSMNQPIKNFQEASSPGSAQAAKPRSTRRFVLTAIVILLVVAGIVWWTKQAPPPEPGCC